MTKNILIFGDSNTWGWDPTNTFTNIHRFSKNVRWTGVLQTELGESYTIIEEGLCGRTTVWDDPVEEYRCGKDQLIPLLDTHKPLDLVIIFLGTNDLKTRFQLSARDISLGAGMLVQQTLERNNAFVNEEPKVLLVAPTSIGPLEGSLFEESFIGSVEKSKELGKHYQAQGEARGVEFLDAGKIISSSPKDGIHLDAEAHHTLGMAVAEKVKSIFG